jgi:nucleotide-binding universal stress UspA family protein
MRAVHQRKLDVSIKSVLVPLSPRSNVTGVLDVALELARQHRAHVVGLWPTAEAGSESSPLEQAFRERAKQLQLSHEWSRVAGNEAAILVLASRCHDLLVIGQAEPDTGRFWPQPHHLLENTLLKSGHPLIAVPRRGAFPSVGERILVAWDGAREAARAVEDAMPFLERAKQVTLVTVDLRSGEALSADHLVALLERHGVPISVRGARSHGTAIGEVVLGRARELGCDLLVMGGYGHSPLRERLFGGPTYFVLEHMDLPVLLSH